jgi:hypothetical protein
MQNLLTCNYLILRRGNRHVQVCPQDAVLGGQRINIHNQVGGHTALRTIIFALIPSKVTIKNIRLGKYNCCFIVPYDCIT